MSLILIETLKHGNLRKRVDVEILPHEVWCPICEEFVDGIVGHDNLYRIEPACNCDMDDHNQELNDANDTIEARDDRIYDLEQEADEHRDEIEELNKEVERLEQELIDAKS